MKINIKFYGQLYWYTDKKKEMEIEVQPKSIESILEELSVPIGEVFMISINKEKVELDVVPNDGDVVEVYPVIGGG